MLEKVFVLGRSGSGKTTAINYIKQLALASEYEAFLVKDYPILYKMFQDDSKQKSGKFKPAAYGGFEVVDFDAFDDALIQVEELAQGHVQKYASSSRYEGVVIIEFARRDYQRVLKKFTPAFLQDSYFFFVEAPVKTCIERISQRITSPSTPDRHYVPEKMMYEYFDKDNMEYMAYKFKDEYQISKDVVTCSNTDSREHFLKVVEAFYETILAREPALTKPLASSLVVSTQETDQEIVLI